MNKKFILLASTSMFLLSTLIGAQLIAAVAAPPPRTPGVSPGDWGLYDVTVSGNLMMPGMENITWAEITVQGISGTNVTFEARARYPNATEETETLVVDVDTGQGNGSGFFVAANLNEGDDIYNSVDPSDMFYGMTINETIFRTYAIGSVEVNHWNRTISYSVPEVMNVISSTNYYWFESTGMLTELYMYYRVEQGGNVTWVEMEVVITGVIPEFLSTVVLPLFMIVTLSTVWLGKATWSSKKSIKKPHPCT